MQIGGAVDARIFAKDEETGFYYYGARYLDPKYSRWMSGEPAMGEYIPQAPVNDEAKKHNEKLPNGGIYNHLNSHIYHYSNNNPVKYSDPDGKFPVHIAIGALIGVAVNVGIVALGDIADGKISRMSDYVGATVSGAVTGGLLAATGGASTVSNMLIGGLGSLAGSGTKHGIDHIRGEGNLDTKGKIIRVALDTVTGALLGRRLKGSKIYRITVGRGSMKAVAKQLETKLSRGVIKKVSLKSSFKRAMVGETKGALCRGSFGVYAESRVADKVLKIMRY